MEVAKPTLNLISEIDACYSIEGTMRLYSAIGDHECRHKQT